MTVVQKVISKSDPDVIVVNSRRPEVDEVHALVPQKRGTHLQLTLARQLCGRGAGASTTASERSDEHPAESLFSIADRRGTRVRGAVRQRRRYDFSHQH
mgnify:CR=1 FL=1